MDKKIMTQKLIIQMYNSQLLSKNNKSSLPLSITNSKKTQKNKRDKFIHSLKERLHLTIIYYSRSLLIDLSML